MQTVRKENTKEPNPGTTDGVATTDTYTIAVHMKEDAYDTKLMGKKLKLSVKLVAYQMAEESDSLGDGYDEVFAAMDVQGLQEGLSEKKDVLLTAQGGWRRKYGPMTCWTVWGCTISALTMRRL